MNPVGAGGAGGSGAGVDNSLIAFTCSNSSFRISSDINENLKWYNIEFT
jgi:hypothetical protein